MSTDFNIKPVGAPVAAPIVQHVSEAAQHAVATELPASQSVAAADCGARASTDSAAVRISISSASGVEPGGDRSRRPRRRLSGRR